LAAAWGQISKFASLAVCLSPPPHAVQDQTSLVRARRDRRPRTGRGGQILDARGQISNPQERSAQKAEPTSSRYGRGQIRRMKSEI